MSRRVPSTSEILRAISNERRLLILEWLLDPVAHFPPQTDGDLTKDGVCLGAIVRKLSVSQPTVTIYMKTLSEAGLVTSKQIKNWVFFKPCRETLAKFLTILSDRLAV